MMEKEGSCTQVLDFVGRGLNPWYDGKRGITSRKKMSPILTRLNPWYDGKRGIAMRLELLRQPNYSLNPWYDGKRGIIRFVASR